MQKPMLSRREFGTGMLSAMGAITASGMLSRLARAATQSSSFYIQHWSSNKFVHPYGGRIHNGVPLVFWDTKAPHARFYFEAVEGPFGYIVSEQDPRYCVHPQGGSVEAGNNTILNLHEARHPGALFFIDPIKRGIRHISGRYWHPLGGESLPTNDTNLVLYDEISKKTKFTPTNGTTKDLVNVKLPAVASAEWHRIGCNGTANNLPQGSGSRKINYDVGLVTRNVNTNVQEVSFGVEVGTSVLFGTINTKISSGFKASFKQERSETMSKRKTVQDVRQWEEGKLVCWWQRKYKAEFDNGAIYEYFSSLDIVDTNSPDVVPSD